VRGAVGDLARRHADAVARFYFFLLPSASLARVLTFQQQSDRALPECARLSDILTLSDASQVWAAYEPKWRSLDAFGGG
jgi:hypothetical protein